MYHIAQQNNGVAELTITPSLNHLNHFRPTPDYISFHLKDNIWSKKKKLETFKIIPLHQVVGLMHFNSLEPKF